MTDADGEKITKAARYINITLHKDKDDLDSSITLEVAERRIGEDALQGLMEMIRTAIEKAESKIERAEGWIARAESLDIQMEMFGDDGKPTSPMDANGKLIPTVRENGIDQYKLPLDEEPAKSPDTAGMRKYRDNSEAVSTIFRQGIQAGLGRGQCLEAASDGTTCTKAFIEGAWALLASKGAIFGAGPDKWSWDDTVDTSLPLTPAAEESTEDLSAPTIPPGIATALVTAVRDGLGKLAAIDAVVLASKVSRSKVDDAWEQLELRGHIQRVGRNWVAEFPEEVPTEAVVG